MRARQAIVPAAVAAGLAVFAWILIAILRPSDDPRSAPPLDLPNPEGAPAASRPAASRPTAVRPRRFEGTLAARSIAVTVVDPNGTPAGDIAVALHAAAPEDRDPEILSSATTDASGRASLEVPDEATGRGVVGLEIPGNGSGAVEVPLDAPPRELPSLRLPPTGELLVRVLGSDDRLLAETASVRLSNVTEWARWHRRTANRFSMTGGELLIRHVPLGVHIDAIVQPARSRFAETGRVLAPLQPGGRVTLEIRMEKRPVLSGRVRDEAGWLVASRKLRVELEVDQPKFPQSPEPFLTTGADGRFSIETIVSGTGRYRLRLTDDATQATCLVQIVVPNVLAHDAGDVVLRVPPPLVSGLVVDGSKKPVEGATVWARQPKGLSWTNLMTQADTRGRFQLYGAAEAEVTIAAWKEGYLETRVPLPAKSEPLEVVIRRMGVIEGSVLLDEGCEPALVTVATEVGHNQAVSADGTFTIGGFGDEDVVLGFYVSDTPWRSSRPKEPQNAVHIERVSVRIEKIETVGPIDLRGKVKCVRLTVVDGSGAPVPEYELTIWSDPPATGPRAGKPTRLRPTESHKGPASLMLATAPTLEVGARGMRSVWLTRVTGDVTAMLGRPYRVRVKVSGLPPSIPQEVSVLASIETGGSLYDYTGKSWPTARGPVEPDGTAVLSVASAGSCRADVVLRRVASKTIHHWTVVSKTIEIADTEAEQTIELAIDPSRFEKSLANILKVE